MIRVPLLVDARRVLGSRIGVDAVLCREVFALW
jgi:hypothetical protein